MSKSESRQNCTKPTKMRTGWEPLLEYAQEALAETTVPAAKLRIEQAIRICERNIAAGIRIPLRARRTHASTHK